MEKIHQYSRSEWNNHRYKLVDANLIYKKPSVWYYIANKYAYICYDTLSLWIDEFDIFKQNKEAEKYLRDWIWKILSQYQNTWMWSSFSRVIKWLDPNIVESIALEIYELLVEFWEKFVGK